MAMTPSSVFVSLPTEIRQNEPLIAATYHIDPCLGPGGSLAALVVRNTANGADMASVRGERDGRSSPIVATVVSLHGQHHHHPSTPRSHTVIGEGCCRCHKAWSYINLCAAFFGRNGGVGVPASGSLGGSTSPNGTHLPLNQHTQQSIGDEERLSWVEDGWGSFH